MSKTTNPADTETTVTQLFGTTCPDCGAETTTVDGLEVCADCSWFGRHGAD